MSEDFLSVSSEQNQPPQNLSQPKQQLLEVKDLKFSYSKAKDSPFLKIPSLVLSKGEKVFLSGPSGCGKSTFLEILSGILKPDAGHIYFEGKDLVALKDRDRDQLRSYKIGYIFQSHNLVPYLSVYENIELPLEINSLNKTVYTKEEKQQEVSRLIDSLELTAWKDNKVTELSVGQQQRVAAARAMIAKPSLILADEPTSSLDYEHREKFMTLFLDICAKENTTVIFVSHDPTLEKYFDRTIQFKDLNFRKETEEKN